MNNSSRVFEEPTAKISDRYLLDRALSLDYMLKEFRQIRSTNWIGAEVTEVRSAQLVRLKPSRRSIVKYDIVLQLESGEKQLPLLGKIRNRSFDWRAFDVATELWNNGFGLECTDGVYVPEPIAAVPRLNMWLQRSIDADSLTASLDSCAGLKYCIDAGFALGKLHSKGPKTDRRRTLTDELETLSHGLIGTCEALPKYSRRIRRLLSSCEALAREIPEHARTGIHRDFYPDQVLSSPRSTWLVDLDLYAEGDPALDLGNFVGHLQELSLRRFGHSRQYATHEQAFLRAYSESTGFDHCRFAVAAYTSLTLVRHVAITQQIPARRKSLEKLLGLCEQRLRLQRKYLQRGNDGNCASFG